MWPPHISRHLATTWAAGMECDTVSPDVHALVLQPLGVQLGHVHHGLFSLSRSGKTRSHASMWKEVSIGY